jgi:hypothetical protein
MCAHRRAVFAILSVGVILATLDRFIANVALPAIRQGLHGVHTILMRAPPICRGALTSADARCRP